MIKRVKNFFSFVQSPSGLIIFLRIGFWLILVSFLLRFFSLPKIFWALEKFPPKHINLPPRKLVDFTSFWLERNFWILKPSCLKRSLVLYRYLNAQALPVKFYLGVKKENDQLKGHCWLTLDNQYLLPEEEPGWKVIYCYPEDRKKAPEKNLLKIID